MFTPLVPTAGGADLEPRHINAAGDIVGQFASPLGHPSAFLWSQGTLTDLTPSASFGRAERVNGAGDVAGVQVTGGVYSGFLYRAGVLTSLALAGATQGSAGDINDAGWVVGFSIVAAGQRAFLHRDGTTYDLTSLVTTPGCTLYFAGAINDAGLIGAYGSFGGALHLLLLAPACGASGYCTSGTSSNGCAPQLSVSGTPSASASSGFTLTFGAAPGQRMGLVFYGLSGRQSVPWGGTAGFACVKAPTQRTPAVNTGGTSGAWCAQHVHSPGGESPLTSRSRRVERTARCVTVRCELKEAASEGAGRRTGTG